MKTFETINILCATDENYAPYCGIMLTSLFYSNRDCHFNVYVFIDGDFSETNKKKYYRLGQKYKNTINLMKIDNSMIEKFPINPGHITRPTYYRFLVAELLPEDIHKVLYLDCDIAVVGDIKPLWNVDLIDKAIAGARGYGNWENEPSCERLGIDFSVGYFNAGVLVINLDYWRCNHVAESLIDFVVSNYDNKSCFLLMDQDILNSVLQNKKVFFPDRYNFRVCVFLKKFWMNYSGNQRNNYLEECGKVSVVHYASREKPWNYRSYGGPFFSEWEKYRRKSMWKNSRDIKPLKKHVKYMIKKYLLPKLFRSLHSEWVVLAENKMYY